MADEDLNDIDTDSMSMEQLSELKGKMEAGEDVRPQTTAPEPDAEAIEQTPEDQEAELAAHDDPPAEGDDKGSKFVPHKTFHYANERRKEAEARAKASDERYARLEERTRLLLEAQSQPAQPKEPEASAFDPLADPSADPMATISAVAQELANRRKAEEDAKRQQSEQSASEQQWQQTLDVAQRQFAEAAQADEHVQPAYEALLKSYVDEMEAMGMARPQIHTELDRIERQHITYAVQSGMPLGEYAKKLAAARGWRPQQAQPVPAVDTQRQDKLDKAREAGASLGASGGAVANTGKITPQQLADMPEAEFREYMKKHGSTRGAFEVA